jgi:DNA polymerase family B
MANKDNNYKIYIHNLSRFDGIFLLKILATLENRKLIPIIKDDKMIALTLKFGSKNKITFHDSMLLLPSSLDKLRKSFNVENKKVVFPIYWLLNNPDFNINYIGNVPDIKYLKSINIEDYNDYVNERNNIWNLKNELLNYNLIDCIALYEILIKFNDLIYDKLSLNAFN